MWEDNKYEPVFIHAKMHLYTLVGLEAGENTPEMTATFFKWWLGIAQFPASASYVNDMKNRIKHLIKKSNEKTKSTNSIVN